MSTGTKKMDELMESLGGCGRFQVLVVFFSCWVRVAGAMSMMMMAFGGYNPGWRCLDNFTAIATDSHKDNVRIPDLNTSRSCQLYEACKNVTFTPGISTVVSEWHLVCAKSWIPSLIISIQMVGVLFGAYTSGYLGDRFGRKTAMYLSTLFHVVVNISAIFSSSWQIFLIMRFLIGFAIPIMLYLPIILGMEFVQYTWRNALVCLPAWSLGCLLFALSAMITEDWRHLHAINAATSVVALLPFYWMPESLRWLVVHDKMKKASAIVNGIGKLNDRPEEGIQSLQAIRKHYKSHLQSHKYSCLLMLRKGVRYPTFVVGFVCISLGLIFYALGFGVKNLPGNLYTNLFIMFACEVAVTPISSILPNYLGRKMSIVIFLIICTLTLFCTVGFDLCAEGNVKKVGTVVSVMVARTSGDAAWDVSVTYIGELFPTVIRSTSVAYSSWVSRIGGIVAPYLILDDPDAYFIYYLIMALLAFICCGLVAFVPKNEEEHLKDIWETSGPEHELTDNVLEDDTVKVRTNTNSTKTRRMDYYPEYVDGSIDHSLFAYNLGF